jgi:hypothetical protein
MYICIKFRKKKYIYKKIDFNLLSWYLVKSNLTIKQLL